MAIMFAIGSTVMSSCSDSASGNNEETHEEHDGDHQAGEEGEEHEHEHGEDDHAGAGHMQHMNDVRDMLKEKLGDKYDEVVPEATAEQLALGKEAYKACSSCHGDTGKGDGLAAAALPQKPADFTDPAHSAYYSDQGRLYIIKNGVEGTPMVGWKDILSEEEILAVYAYVRSLRSEEVGDHDHDHSHEAGMYACPMHPEITSDKPGQKCSKCGMELVMHDEDEEHSDGDHDH